MLIPRPVGQDAEGREGSMVCHLWLNDASLYHYIISVFFIIPLSYYTNIITSYIYIYLYISIYIYTYIYIYLYIIIYIRLSYSMTGVPPWYLLVRPLSRSPPGGPLLGPGCSAWRTTASLAPLTVTRKRSGHRRPLAAIGWIGWI